MKTIAKCNSNLGMRNLWCSVNKGGFKYRIKLSSTSAFHSFPFVFQLASTQPALQIGQGLFSNHRGSFWNKG